MTRTALCILAPALLNACGPIASPVQLQQQNHQGIVHAADWTVYDDSVHAPFVNTSPPEHALSQKGTVHSGDQALRLHPGHHGTLRLHAETPVDASPYSALAFWLNAGDAGPDADVTVQLRLADGQSSQAVHVQSYAPDGELLPQQTWVYVRIPFIDLNPHNLVLSDIIWRGGRGDAQPVYVDDVRLLSSRTAAGTWLYTQGNRIKWPSGYNFHGRGANVQDPRGCGACISADPWQSATEVNRRIDTLVDNWGATFLRLTLESDYYSSVLTDATYLQTIQNIVQHVLSKNIMMELSVWLDPSLSSQGWPTSNTIQVWQKLAQTFATTPNVMFGLVNEPQNNYDGSQNAAVWTAMNNVVAAIRTVESWSGNSQHIILVQGTGGWSRFLSYYTSHPITAGGGANIAYEVHVYDSSSTFWDRFGSPSQTIPVVISEYGPVAGSMTNADCTALQQQAKQYEVPYLAWTFHDNCPPNLLVNTASGCGLGMSLQATSWGQMVKSDLAQSW